jgi:four helix bundle protein
VAISALILLRAVKEFRAKLNGKGVRSPYIQPSPTQSANELSVATVLPPVPFMSDEQSFKGLDVWQEAMTLVEEIYVQSRQFPQDERFGLTSQLRRAAASVPSNIGEGARRRRPKANLNHLEIALGSQGELDVQLEIAFRLGYCELADYQRIQERVSRVGRMLNGLIASVKQRAGQAQS